jgi:hypothetical protein
MCWNESSHGVSKPFDSRLNLVSKMGMYIRSKRGFVLHLLTLPIHPHVPLVSKIFAVHIIHCSAAMSTLNYRRLDCAAINKTIEERSSISSKAATTKVQVQV